MKTWVVITAPERAESVRRTLRGRGLLRKGVRVVRSEREVTFPVESAPDPPLEQARAEERELPMEPLIAHSYRELISFDASQRALLPRSFDVIGDVILIRLPTELEPRATEIGDALLRFVPGARRVGWDQGVHGTERIRRLRPLAGVGPWRTHHRENGIELTVDPETAYFSPRLAGEHARIASEVRPGETVWDLCCGIGPFALTIARRNVASRIVAVDSNSAAIALLQENARRLGVEGRIDARNETIERFVASAATADRLILNLPLEGIKYLTSVSASAAPGGIVHYYEVTRRADRSMRERELVDQLAGPGEWTRTDTRRVHPYSPQADLLAYTFLRK